MEPELTTTDIPPNKTKILLSVVAVVLVLSIIGACIPTCREYAVGLVKSLLSLIPIVATLK